MAAVVLLAPTPREAQPLAMRGASRADGAVHVHVVGVGKAAAACETALLLERMKPRVAILAGCAGAFPSSGLRVGDVVAADLEVFADEGVAAPQGFLDLEAIGLPMAERSGERVFTVVPLAAPDDESLAAARSTLPPGASLLVGRLATVSTCSGSKERLREIERRSGALAESMEGAACALAAARLGVRFHEVRGISNLAGPRDPAAWDVDLACRNAAGVAWAIAVETVKRWA